MNNIEARPAMKSHADQLTGRFGPSMTDTLTYRNDFKKIDQLHKEFNLTLGARDKKDITRSYDPVLPRAKYEKLATPGQKEKFKKYEVFQMQTNLRERYHAAKSAVTYTIDEYGNVYNELFPDEPFDAVLKRGLEYRREIGSLELDREESELIGWTHIKTKLADPNIPLGAKCISISGPGIVADTSYKDNFVDIFESAKASNTGKRVIKMTRYASGMTYGQYWDKALLLNPSYFEGISGSIDAWFLRNPMYIDPTLDARSPEELFDEVFTKRKDALKEDDFQDIYKACLPLILYYVDVLCSEPFDPQAIKIAFNAILKKGDLTRDSIQWERENRVNVSANASYVFRRGIIFNSVQQEAAFLGRQHIETVDVGCGSSGGFILEGTMTQEINPSMNLMVPFLSNSVGKFSFEPIEDVQTYPLGQDKHGSLKFKCPKEKCKGINRRPFGKLLKFCQHCLEELPRCA